MHPISFEDLALIIECSYCHARYNYDEARFEGKPSKKIRCAKCQEIFEIRNPRPAPAAGSSPMGTHSDIFDLTSSRGIRRPPPVAETNPLEEAMSKLEMEENKAAAAAAAGTPHSTDRNENPLKLPEGKRISL